MDSPSVWFAIIAAIAAGAGLQQRRHGRPVVRKRLIVILWIAAIVAFVAALAAAVN
jgi:hypothetical protein